MGVSVHQVSTSGTIGRVKRNSLGPLWLFAGLLLGHGCAKSPEQPWETFSETQDPYKPAQSSNAYDGYLLAAESALRQGPEAKDVVNFRPSDKAKILAATRQSVARATAASLHVCDFEFRVTDPFKPRASHDGVTLLGNAFAWSIEEAGENGRFAQAANLAVVATKIGCDWTGGDTSDALLGQWFAESSREAMLPYLDECDGPTLRKLGNGVLRALDLAPKPTQTVDNELLSMLAGIQFVQDRFRERDFETLTEAMYKEGREAIDYLKKVDDKDRTEYFRGFAAEAKSVAAHFREQSLVPKVERKDLTVDTSAPRPWKRFSKQLFETLPAWIDANDRHVARTRLFGLTCLAKASTKESGAPPKRFERVPVESTIDPYTGRDFPYRVAGKAFSVYSVGADGRDDGGESNETGYAPDLVLGLGLRR